MMLFESIDNTLETQVNEIKIAKENKILLPIDFFDSQEVKINLLIW